ncbi:hypothetical protein CDV36_012954 [Fusarium kuroshium]|uniref:Zn(2)-C6 fungal-type domain-containing protein n=1 Tax=Fusarium kuroshium TaxID=2010991 RepID=A0A3M2RQ44_9HYPO|nr:hypothetical protein CDV36_012954 [Fusarium kuroshium]
MSGNQSDSQDEGRRSPRAAGPTANHFSCVNCRRRKIKCNKQNPCTNCTKAQLTCVFPPPRRSGRDSNPDPALLAKVRRLEGIISSLQLAVVEKDAQLTQLQSRPGQAQDRVATPNIQLGSPVNPETSETTVAQKRPSVTGLDPHSPTNSAFTNPQSTTDWKYGKLVRDEGRSIYIGSTFWASLTAHGLANDMSFLDHEPLDDETNSYSQHSSMGSPLSDFPLSSTGAGQYHAHPSVENRQKLWSIFKESVDPIVKILHLPTAEIKINEWLQQADTDGIPRNVNALLFAIYFAAVSSVEDDVCRDLLGCDRGRLVVEFRVAEENALSIAGFINTDDLMVLQAFVIYLVSLRQHSPRVSWTLCPLAFRILQLVGAHRDGSPLSLLTYDSEMHKRLCWHLCLLECGASDDSGCEPTILEISSFNAPAPRNLNDQDYGLDIATEPETRTCWTESTLLILEADICQLWRLIWDSRRHPDGIPKPFDALTEAEKSGFIESCARRFDEQYIKICSPLIPIQWVTATLARMLILEFKLAVCRPLERHAELGLADCDQFFADAMECLELSNKLLTDGRSVRWTWLFKTFTLWHALAFMLTELGLRPLRRDHQKAWRVIEQVMISRWNSPHYRLGHQWRSMLNLLEIAQAAKTREIRRRRESFRSRPDAKTAAPRTSPQSAASKKPREAWNSSCVHGHAPLSTTEEACAQRRELHHAGQVLHNAMQAHQGHHDTDMLSLDMPLDMTGEIGDLDMLGDFDFDKNVIEMNTSDAAFLHVAFQVQEGFETRTESGERILPGRAE